MLGPKDSPYRADDFNLLAAFAQITVLALESAEGHRTIEGLNLELQDKLEKISEQQRRILALQSQLSRQSRPIEDGQQDAPKTAEPAKVSPSGIVGSSPVHTATFGPGPQGGHDPGGSAHPRRERHWQGIARPRRA